MNSTQSTITDKLEDVEQIDESEEPELTYTITGRLVVTSGEVGEVVALWTGLPTTNLTRAQAQRFLSIEQDLGKHIIGQNTALAVIAKSMKRYAVGLRNPKRPIGSFFLCGPTGVGKTELSKKLAEIVFGSEKALIRLDMSEYMEKHTVSRLIGSPPGYVGFEEGGQLTDAVRSRPYSIVLFDEIEKAHPDVSNVLLQILDDGFLSDSAGRTVSFQNTLIILTSNLGAQKILDFCEKNPIRTSENEDNLKEIVTQTLGTKFRPEFLNRLDDIVIFHPLTQSHINSITHLLLTEVDQRLSTKGFRFLVTSRILNKIYRDGFDAALGARPLRRAVNKWVEDPIAEKLLKVKRTIQRASFFIVDIDKDNDEKPLIVIVSPYIGEMIKTNNYETL